MGKRIRELPADLKAKIAAGEVIERPSSVVKELVENSVDAGSTDIAITVVAGGKSLIKVTDNGAGIDPEDCPLVFKPHATSKIHTEEELNRISTMGFRGEALYSISVVSRVTMRTKKRGNLSGTKITIEGGSPPVITEDGCPDGTTVEVRDLFFNTPARRKFLKSERTEFARILDVVKRLSLAHPNIRFRLFNGTSKVLDTGGAGIKERIYHIIDEEVAKGLITAELYRPPYRLYVALSPPELSYPTARLLFINVNRRPVKDSMLTHALVDGY
ncbi:MAG TPA: DNA mismatch repair endonuclease MutL, partial [Deltaproteobacteria bacterium]|nr:DNA mismatch repair endonuclease MutL [Deltaproteobacteria bacterium]